MTKEKTAAADITPVQHHPDAATSTADFVSKRTRSTRPAKEDTSEADIEVSAAAQKLLDQNSITADEVAEHAGKNKIGKPDVEAYLASLEDEEGEE